MEEKSLLEKDEKIIFTKDPTTIFDEEDLPDQEYTPRAEPIHFDFSDKKENSRNKLNAYLSAKTNKNQDQEILHQPAFQTMARLNLDP